MVGATGFVGRRHELRTVREALASSRLVTISGPGGVGKTRLAIEAADRMRRAFPDGVWFVDLSDHSDAALVPSVVASTVGLTDAGPLAASLASFFADRRALVVLDNCEHVIDAAATLATSLIRTAGDLAILVTSRQVLGVPEEVVLLLTPLSLPGSSEHSVADAVLSEAVTLFVERSRGVLHDFAVTEDNVDDVIELCRRLDGLPLAIEMATTRLRGLSVAQINARLDHRYDLLTEGSRVSAERQSSLEKLVGWSYEHCSEAERRLWRRSSVFSGGFELEAAELVCSDELLSREAVLPTVIGLVEKSILIRDERAGVVRFRSLDTILDYGRRRLQEYDELPDLQERHAQYVLDLVEDALGGWYSANEPALRRSFRDNMANVRSALDFCISHEPWADTGLRIAGSFWYGWRVLGLVSEGRHWLQRTLEVSPDRSQARARALWVVGGLAVYQGDDAAARACLREAATLAESTGDAETLAFTALYDGQLALSSGETDAATRLFETALERQRALDNPVGTAMALTRLALVRSQLGQVAQARHLIDDYLLLSQSRGSDRAVATARWAKSVISWQHGEAEDAVHEARAAMTESWPLQDLVGLGRAMEVLAWASASKGDAERTAWLVGASDRMRSVMGGHSFGYEHLSDFTVSSAATATRALGEERFQALFEAGASSDPAEALAFATGETPQGRVARRGAGDTTSALSRREVQVAQLVAEGMSNKEIASALVISQRTAEAHVEHILMKLGFTSRAQVVGWVKDGGLPVG